MTIAVDRDVKQHNKQTKHVLAHSFYCHSVESTCATMVHTKISNEVHARVPVEGIVIEPVHEISNNVICATSKASDQPAHRRSLIRAFASRLSIL